MDKRILIPLSSILLFLLLLPPAFAVNYTAGVKPGQYFVYQLRHVPYFVKMQLLVTNVSNDIITYNITLWTDNGTQITYRRLLSVSIAKTIVTSYAQNISVQLLDKYTTNDATYVLQLQIMTTGPAGTMNNTIMMTIADNYYSNTTKIALADSYILEIEAFKATATPTQSLTLFLLRNDITIDTLPITISTTTPFRGAFKWSTTQNIDNSLAISYNGFTLNLPTPFIAAGLSPADKVTPYSAITVTTQGKTVILGDVREYIEIIQQLSQNEILYWQYDRATGALIRYADLPSNSPEYILVKTNAWHPNYFHPVVLFYALLAILWQIIISRLFWITVVVYLVGFIYLAIRDWIKNSNISFAKAALFQGLLFAFAFVMVFFILNLLLRLFLA